MITKIKINSILFKINVLHKINLWSNPHKVLYLKENLSIKTKNNHFNSNLIIIKVEVYSTPKNPKNKLFKPLNLIKI
jgi:hypothetical protein